MWYVYILFCKDKTLYTGISDDPQKRFKNHLSGKGSRYTRSHKPVKIIHQEKYPDKSSAMKREAQIKKMSRQEKMKLIGLKI
jgi:putative endonuclease